MTDRPILVISGTNRPGSNTQKLANVVHGHYVRLKIPVEMYSLTELPPEIFDRRRTPPNRRRSSRCRSGW
jgi:NAD(P)H-dependent FMN reductase